MLRKSISAKALIASILFAGTVGAIALAANAYLNTKSIEKDVNGYIIQNRGAVQWQLNSGEAEALEYQSYNLATSQLLQAVKMPSKKPKAVILDIDETVLSNYGNIIDTQIKTTDGYSKASFSKWAKQEKAKAIPGAVNFLKTSKNLGIETFYISDRFENADLSSTIDNLKKLGMPYADKEHVLLKTTSSSKQARVNSISNKFDVVMYIGDNLDDFPKGFDHKSNIARKEMVKANEEDFGTKYIIIPNAAYGSWDGATFGYDYKKTSEQKIQDRNNALIALENN